MKLTPLDVRKHEFKKTIRGYDPVEADAFLEMVSDELEALIREKNELSDEVLKLKTQLSDYQNVEKTLQQTLVTAQETITQSKENSSRAAEMLIREAELNAEKVVRDARLRLAEMKNELVVIKAQKNSFARRLKHLLESQIELIEVLELDDLGFERYEVKLPNDAKRETPTPIQEKIEFEAVEDVLPEEPLASDEVAEVASDETHGIRWGKRIVADEDALDRESDTQQSRISDKLII
ncbi:MAG: DivIVA domain-containing protein [Calditrichaeota bacterium]|nr:DivIVA domain-containing protein [Calditrichota bacterium]